MYRFWFLLSFLLAACPGPSGPGDISGTISIGSAAMNFVPGEAIVRFKGVELQSLRLQSSGIGLQQVENLGVPGAALYRAKASKAQTLQMIGELSARPDVLYAHPNYIMQPLKSAGDQSFKLQWDLPAIKVPEAWDIEDGTSNPVTVAVIDTGILAGHPDFVGKIAVGGYDFISSPDIAVDGDGRDNDPQDVGDNPAGQSSYHGSHVAGTVAAAVNSVGIAGMSWGAKILPLRALGKGGGTVSDIVAALRYAAGLNVAGVAPNPNPAQIINLSLGGAGQCAQMPIYQDTIDQIGAAGAFLVVAAGNDNQDASRMAPASCSGVITVGATDPSAQRARYSNFGPHVDVMAPGGDVLVNLGGQIQGGGILAPGQTDSNKELNWNYKNGTSMAAPHVAGLLALMKSRKPDLSFSQAQDILKQSSQPLSLAQCRGNRAELGVDDCGNGLINAQAALQILLSAPPSDFSLSLSPDSPVSAPNEKVGVGIQIQRSGGFAGAVSLKLIGPPEIGGGFDSAQVSANSATLTLHIPNQAPKNHSLVVEGTSATLIHRADLTLSVVSTGSSPTLQNVRIKACPYSPSKVCEASTREIILNTTLRSMDYRFSDLEGGSYLVTGFKDVNGNEVLDQGDYYGYFDGPVQPTRTGVDVMLEPR
jgi:serine protease